MAGTVPWQWLVIASLICLGLCQGYTRMEGDEFGVFQETILLHPIMDYLDPHKGSILQPIMKPRVAGTTEHERVMEYLVSFLRHNLTGWHVEIDNSTQQTPRGPVEFRNIIATKASSTGRYSSGRLVIAAHYDSKFFSGSEFIGATDSAVSCALILYAMAALDRGQVNDEHGLQIIFFDGEEAVQDWTQTDSIYGARHLADKWDHTYSSNKTMFRQSYLTSIELLCLLDLLGAANPSIPSFFPTTHWAYNNMADIENRIRQTQKVQRSVAKWFPDAGPEFKKNQWQVIIEDDHSPFLARGVNVLHLIPLPFPEQWHKLHDDAAHLDAESIYMWTRVLTTFVAEWMDWGITDLQRQTERSHLILDL